MAALEIECPDNRIGDLGKSADAFNDGHSGHSSGSFIEAYARGVMHLGALCAFEKKPQYGFTWVADPTSRDGPESLAYPKPTDRGFCWSDIGGQKTLMLPCNVQLMASPERSIPSLVRFEIFDDVPASPGQLPYKFEAPVISSRKVVSTPSHGEINSVRVEDHFAFGNGTRQYVQTTSDGVNIGACLDAELQRQKAFFSHYNGIVSRWGWAIYDNYFEVIIEPSAKNSLKGWEFGYGPFNRSARW